MDSVRRDTAGSPASNFLDTNCKELSTFTACTSPELRRIINSSPSSTCELDPAPTFIVKEFLDTPYAVSIPDSDVQRFAAGGLHSIVSDKSGGHPETQKVRA